MALGQTEVLEIRTPEGVVFSLPLAGPVARCLAVAIDFALVIGMGMVVSIVLTLASLVSPAWSTGATYIAMFVLKLGYPILCEWLWRGKTVGKLVMRLRVVDERGLGLRFGQVVIRNILRLVDFAPAFYVVGGLSMALTRHCQRLGDLAAGTVVIRTPPLREPRLDQIMAGQFNSFRDHALVEARLRQRATPEEAALALSAVLRRESLEPGERLRVYGQLADHFRTLARFPDEVETALTDEQYVRNVVDSLFRKRGT